MSEISEGHSGVSVNLRLIRDDSCQGINRGQTENNGVNVMSVVLNRDQWCIPVSNGISGIDLVSMGQDQWSRQSGIRN